VTGRGQGEAAVAAAPDGAPSQGSAWTAGQVAHYLGISESTLRTWHRRYGLDPEGSQSGRYRRYRPADVARLRRMLDLIGLGMLASEAARAVQSAEPDAVSSDQEVADLVGAARALDTDRCRALLDVVFARSGVVGAWEQVCRPALVAVDAEQLQDPDCVDIEHTLSWAILTTLAGLPRPPADPASPRILLACTDGELHTLPLAALAAALAEHQVDARMIGAASPTRSLVRAVREVGPDTIVLWAQRPETAGAEALAALGACPVRVVAAGPGWPSSQVPGVWRVTTLPEAVALLTG
jgi:DNA-binding transcriptional MerR regulator